MALKRLTLAEMISVSSPWIAEGHDERAALQEIEDTRPVLRRIELAHAALVELQPKGAPSPALAALQAEAASLDDEHDDVVRGTMFLINGHALLQRDKAQRDALLKLRDTLFPTGPAVTQKSHREESGQAEMLKGRLTPPMKVLLKSIPSPDAHLLATIQRYLRVAQRLGTIEDRKLLAASKGSGPSAAEVTLARNRWIRAVNVLIATLEQEDIESPWAATILERIRQAEVTAERRAEPEASGSGVPEAPADGALDIAASA